MAPKKQVYQFKIILKDTKPPIWRRIQVPNHFTFWDLHVAIQDAMGWIDCHLHEFRLPALGGKTLNFGIPDEEFDDDIRPGWKSRISRFLSLERPVFEYVYDFGDNWRHKVELERVLPAEPDKEYPRCIKGRRACPPEDCGGPWGYQNLLEILSDPQHEQHAKMKDWVTGMTEGPFNPEEFDPDEVVFHDPQQRFDWAFGEGNAP